MHQARHSAVETIPGLDGQDALPTIPSVYLPTSGRPGPTLGQQLAALESQMAELVHGMGAAMKSVLFVTIWFRHNHIRSGRSSAKAITTSNDTQIPTAAGCPASFAVAARTVCTLLAEALPCLCQLSLQGCCRDPAFASFGASCPDLTYLQVEALSLPIKALKSITTHLPQLHSLSLTSPYLCPDGPQLMEYVEESLLALQPSTLINSFDLRFRMNTPLVCKPGCWLQLPPNLHAFHSSCEIRGILHATALLGAIRDLFLAQPLRLDELLQILSLAPQLQKLYLFTDPACLMQCGREDIMSGIALLRERLLTGLELCLSSIHLVESSGSLAAVLTAMPAHVNLARRCVLTFSFDPQPQCMAEVARVFRGLYELTLLSSTAVVGKNVLRPLVACTSLRKLHICLTISHTTTDLVQLCLDMPALKVLHFKKSAAAAVDLPELLSALAAQGRVMEIKDTLV